MGPARWNCGTYRIPIKDLRPGGSRPLEGRRAVLSGGQRTAIRPGRALGSPAPSPDRDQDSDRGEGDHPGGCTKTRLIIRRGFGFHSAEAVIALVVLAFAPAPPSRGANPQRPDPHTKQESLSSAIRPPVILFVDRASVAWL